MSNIVEFAKRMKAQREKHGLTQAQLGEKVGLSFDPDSVVFTQKYS